MVRISQSSRGRRAYAATIVSVLSVLVVSVMMSERTLDAEQGSTVQDSTDGSLLDGFRHVEVASVSDALEQLTGKKMYMSHRMRPIFPTRFTGFALTVSLKKEQNHDPDALKGMLSAIDHGNQDSVYVMVVEDGIDIAGMGGLMGTAMSSRNFSGAIIDGGVRDVSYLQKIGFPVCGCEYSGSMRRGPRQRWGHCGGGRGWRCGCAARRCAPGTSISQRNGFQ